MKIIEQSEDKLVFKDQFDRRVIFFFLSLMVIFPGFILYSEHGVVFILLATSYVIVGVLYYRPYTISLDRHSQKLFLSRVGIFGFYPKEYLFTSIDMLDLEGRKDEFVWVGYRVRLILKNSKKIRFPKTDTYESSKQLAKTISEFIRVPFDDRGYLSYKGLGGSKNLVWSLILLILICLGIIYWVYR